MNMKKEGGAKDAMSLSRAFRDMLLEADSNSLAEVLTELDIDAATLAEEGKAAVENALQSVPESPITEDTDTKADVAELHKALGALLQLLRRRDDLSQEELADRARIEIEEIRRIEHDPTYTPLPRTIYQLEQTFRLPRRTLIKLSGLTTSHSAEFKGQVLRFAAHSKAMHKMTREEKKLLNEFVKFLNSYTHSPK
jgi:transcriptional regulator with XRE-family HTH domain